MRKKSRPFRISQRAAVRRCALQLLMSKQKTLDKQTLKEALQKEKWGKKYPYAISNWENNWEDVSSFFQFSNDIRRIMYTTNIIEGLNRQYRKVTKTKSVFPSDSALEKMLYLASENVVKKWTQRYRNWDQVLNQLIVLYGERLTAYL